MASARRDVQGAAGALPNASEPAAPASSGGELRLREGGRLPPRRGLQHGAAEGGELPPSEALASPPPRQQHRRAAGAAEGSTAAELSQSQGFPLVPVVGGGAALALAISRFRLPFLPPFEVEAARPDPALPTPMPNGPLVDVLKKYGKVMPGETPEEFFKWNGLVSGLTFLKRETFGDVYSTKLRSPDGAPLIVKTTAIDSLYMALMSGREELALQDCQGDHVQVLLSSFKAKVPAFDDDHAGRIQVRFMVIEQGDGSYRDKILPFIRFIPLEKKYTLMLDLLRGLSQISRRGVVHRNINPDSVIVVKRSEKEFDYSIEIGDFSMAKEVAPRRDPWKSLVGKYVGGSPIYIAPEIWHGEMPDTASDMFSVGLMLYELFVGQLPEPVIEASRLVLPDMKLDDDHPIKVYFDENTHHYHWRSDKGLQELGWESPGLAAFIASLLRYDPKERPPTHRAVFIAEQLERDFRDHVLNDWPS